MHIYLNEHIIIPKIHSIEQLNYLNILHLIVFAINSLHYRNRISNLE